MIRNRYGMPATETPSGQGTVGSAPTSLGRGLESASAQGHHGVRLRTWGGWDVGDAGAHRRPGGRGGGLGVKAGAGQGRACGTDLVISDGDDVACGFADGDRK